MWNETGGPLTCTGCGLGCDDLEMEVVDGKPGSLTDHGCPIARSFFASALERDSGQPRINGTAVSLEHAIRHGAQLLRRSTAPLFAGLNADVNGIRATLELADHCGATLDHLNGDAIYRNIRVLQDSGWFTTTFAEVRNRATLIILIGNHCLEQFPRLTERILNPPQSPPFAPGERKLVLLGHWEGREIPTEIASLNPTVIDAELSALSDITGLLRCLIADRPISARTAGERLGRQLEELAADLLATPYSVICWSAAELEFPHADLTIYGLAELVKDLNRTTRSAAMPLAGLQADTTTTQICTWQLGYPFRVGLQRGYPEHEPILYRYQDLLRRKEADLLLWLTSFSPLPPPDTDLPTIVLAPPGVPSEEMPDLYIPVGTPGVDHPGHYFRGDSICPIPLGRIRESELPTAAQVLKAMHAECRTPADTVKSVRLC